ncbi:MAG: lipopolysaccharide biosynthesis protein [Aquabacterium sp.]|uniref:lipopolysaccharide biosynthesis protein n=1 Tax=Aquabacterium sp. TaxID=1872578 RepID=UPI003BEA54E4
MADQGLVSACNFLVSALIARFLGVSEFGHWALVFGVVLYVNTVAGALIWLPMLTLAPRLDGVRKMSFLRGTLASQIALALVAASVVLFAGSLLRQWRPDWLTSFEVCGLSAVVLCFQLQDWVRRYCFLTGAPHAALWMDLLAYGGQVGALAVLHQKAQLTVGSALLCVASCYALGSMCGLVFLRLSPSWTGFRFASLELWRVGRAYLVAEQSQWLGSAGLLYVVAHLLGPQASGAVRATQNLLGPTNVLFQAFHNVIQPGCVEALKNRGHVGMSRYLRQVAVWVGGGLAMGLLLISIEGADLMAWVFGPSYRPYGALVTAQSAVVALTFVWLLSTYRARALDHSTRIMSSGVLQALLSVVVVWLAAPGLQAYSVALASCVGMLAALVVLWKS